MVLSQLLRTVRVLALHADPKTEIPAIVSDSRRATAGCLFLCLRGSRSDGHQYIADAAAHGAAVAVIDAQAAPPEIPYVVVEDTRLAAAQIWNAYWDDPTRDMRVIAVTGTNGKTSTAWLLRAILQEAGYKTGIIGTVCCVCGEEILEIGGGGELADIPAAMTTPDPEFLYGTAARMREQGVEILILEASSHALAQRKLDPMQIEWGIFTNLSPEHLDFHGTMDAYASAKAHLFSLSAGGILWWDDPYAERMAEACAGRRIVRCSGVEKSGADCRALRKQFLGTDGIAYLYYSSRAVFRVRCPIPGQFTVANSLLAATAAWEMGADAVSIQRALENFPGVAGRMERIGIPGASFSLFVDYAHTPAALEALLCTMREVRLPGQKITLLFGCGGDRDPTKRPVMGRIASALADFVIVTSDNSRTENTDSILRGILRGMDREKPYVVIPDRREAIRFAIEHAKQNEILLFAGKGHEKYEIRADGVFPFDEAQLARECFSAGKKKNQ